MTSRERIATIFAGGIPDRVGMHDSAWGSTLERWRREGLPEGVSPLEYLGGNDIVMIGADDTLRFPLRVLEETEEHRVYVDANGVTRKDLKTGGGWTPHWLDYTIRDRRTWEAHRGRLAYDDARLPENALETYRRARREGKFVMYYGHACFHPIWHWIGQVNEFLWMVEQPDLVREMFGAFAQLVIDNYEGIKAKGVAFDGVFMADDMGYRNGTLFSDRMYRELVFPSHRRICDHAAADGLAVTLHSDGDIRAFIPMFIEAGFRGLHPLEAKAGIDVRDLKRRYGGRLVLHGNIDVRALATTREAIEEEVRTKVDAAKQGGGYIYHSDHSVPHDVSWENYVFAIEMVKKYGSYE
ncbi:MAG: hypothetical protein A3F84_02705 [Candidatus Handelsmanbacteria bacterium RIFCSPLOWO2_12_FULL_64_10]|uniref:Uroporphyrinogen decarboxylase (URO-D) domain-containing protein n=1 Tax=Handelsmanbacteria sp. (strain RIFCSPLOWO2_12_FULL_64_10) TaxID=1817868 RepID=A0A1F6CWM2_HANXR|nr:MAG: hypothetical protein A3F84_02705 [Candidatus Handelsmanbacteria bacterium RIFCSPLOWO2_12_FULL_64_10]